MPVQPALGGGACYDPGACHDSGAGSCHCRLCAGEILHGCPDPCGRRHRIQQAVCPESGCRTAAFQMPKGGACHGAEDGTQGKVREPAAAVRPYRIAAGCKPSFGIYGAADLGLCPKSLRKTAHHLSPHRQPVFDGGHGGLPAGAGDGHGQGVCCGRAVSHPCAAGHQRQQGHRPPCAAAYEKYGKSRPCRPPCRRAECPAADCRTAALRRR